MDARALGGEAQVISGHYSIDTAANLHPQRCLNTPGSEDATVPTLSPAVLALLAACHIDVATLANKPVVVVPKIRDDLPLKRYFISSSHNTYLLGWQLLGRSSAAAYTHVLLAQTPARCIEIDVWWHGSPGQGMPIVTHGWTLSKSVPFVDVCTAIGEAVKRIRDEGEGLDWPVLVSLECHVPLAHQDEIVQIMVDCWGEMLVQGEIAGDRGETVTPKQLRGRIVLMVEYYPQGLVLQTEEGEAGDDDTDAAFPHPKIGGTLSRLGFYAPSMKPPKEWWSQAFPSPPYPPNIILNINEFVPLLDTLPIFQEHAARYFRRVYPNGRRVTSSNLDPWIQWLSGTQMACLNWQDWDDAMRLNEAMFAGTGGWVVRPDHGDGRKCKFMARVFGLSALPRDEDQHNFVGYCQAELFHRDGKRTWQSDPVLAQHDTAQTRTKDTDALHLTWDQTFEWTFDAGALAFLQIKLTRRHTIRRDEDLAVFCARLDQLASGWCLVRLLDTRGKHTGATLLCEFTLVCEDQQKLAVTAIYVALFRLLL